MYLCGSAHVADLELGDMHAARCVTVALHTYTDLSGKRIQQPQSVHAVRGRGQTSDMLIRSYNYHHMVMHMHAYDMSTTICTEGQCITELS